MALTAAVDPTAEQLQRLAGGAMDEPLVMLNLLRFREQAQYAPDFEAEPCTGEQAYARYAEGALAAIGGVGGRPLWFGTVGEVVIGPAGEEWDQAFLIHYPSRAKFIEMTSDPDYLAIVPHRSAALADSRLILCGADADAPGGTLAP